MQNVLRRTMKVVAIVIGGLASCTHTLFAISLGYGPHNMCALVMTLTKLRRRVPYLNRISAKFMCLYCYGRYYSPPGSFE